jgi:hypothetical protein
MSRRRSDSDGDLPPLLVWLINAAKHARKDAEGGDIGGAPNALRDLGALASRALPVHGVFVANNPDICGEIQRISKAHLGLDQARRECRKALKVVEAFDQRDPIESAHNHLRSVEDQAYYYAGLAFGIVLGSISVRASLMWTPLETNRQSRTQ